MDTFNTYNGEFRTWGLAQDLTYFPRVLRANSNAKLCSDEGVVDEVGDILERLPIILTDGQEVAAKFNANQRHNMSCFCRWDSNNKTYLR